MKVHQWQGPGFRVTRTEDRFFSSPLSEMTLFRFATRRFEVEPHTSEFSLKVVLGGEERYLFGRRVVTLRPGQALLVNAGETYASVIDDGAESLSVFFRPVDAAAAACAAMQSPEELFSSSTGREQPPEVVQVPFPSSPAFRHRLGALVATLDINDEAVVEEEARQLLSAGLIDLWRIAPPAALGHIRKRGTRDELIRRIERARRLIADATDRDLSLDQLADEACLSRFHFLRVFAEVVGETPIAYARRQRLEHARRALAHGETCEHAARLAGYRNLRAFRRAYRRRFRYQR